jgi:hypothetical protein
MTAGQWFYVSGFFTFMFGLGLLALALSHAKQARRDRRRPVRTIERLDLYEVSLGPHGYGVGFGVPPEIMRPTVHSRPAATRVMPRVRR